MIINSKNNNILRRYTKYIILLSLLFFIIYSFLAIQTPEKFSSPDENANFLFSKQFIENSKFEFDEPLNIQFDNIIHPRNSVATDSKIVPFSFIGFIFILGIIGKIFGLYSLYFVTPFFAAISGIYFFILLKEIFSLKISFLSTLIYFIHPAIWYYSSLSFQHNSLFLSFLILSLFSLVYLIKNNKTLYYLLFGLFLAITCMIRTNEIVWILFLILSILFLYRKKIKFVKLLLCTLIFIIALSPMLILNNTFYGNPLKFGYFNSSNSNNNDIKNQKNSAISFLLNKPKKILFPSGINLNKTIDTFYKYQIKIFYLYFFLLLIGFYIIFNDFRLYKKSHKTYILLFTIVSTYLIIYYGSGTYFGSTSSNLKEIYISSSLVRYWLPIYTFGIPVIITSILNILNLFNKKNKKIFIFSLITILFLFSANTVYNFPDSGLIKISENEHLYKKISHDIINTVGKDSIIITNQTDKIIYPERKVIALHSDLENNNRLDNKWDLIYGLLDQYNVYYFTMYGSNIDTINNKINNNKIIIRPLKTIQDISSLYQLQRIN